MDPPPSRSEAATSWKRWLLGPTPTTRALLYEEAASLVAAGIGLREAVADLLARSSGRRRRALERLADALAHDVPPGAAMAGLPEHFAPAEAALVGAGARTGRYDAAFREAAAEVQRARAAASRVLRAVAYPLFLLHFGLFVSGCAVVQMLHGAAAARVFVWTAFLGLWAAVLGLWTLHVARRGTVGWSRALSRLPLAGSVFRSASLSRCCRIAAALHGAGTDLPETLTDAADAAGNGWIAEGLRAAAADVRRGTSATSALARVEAFDAAARSLLETAERSGTLDQAFARIAVLEDERFERSTRALAVGLGAAIFGFVALAVLWMMATVLGRAYGG